MSAADIERIAKVVYDKQRLRPVTIGAEDIDTAWDYERQWVKDEFMKMVRVVLGEVREPTAAMEAEVRAQYGGSIVSEGAAWRAMVQSLLKE